MCQFFSIRDGLPSETKAENATFLEHLLSTSFPKIPEVPLLFNSKNKMQVSIIRPEILAKSFHQLTYKVKVQDMHECDPKLP